jgi:SAM-dependent methyltransferase
MDGDSLTAATQRFYNAMAQRNPRLAFLNFGYDAPGAPADEMDEGEVAAASQRLYDAALAGFRTAKDVLEVGCGRGAGAAFVLSSRGVGRYMGLDLSDEHVRLCRSHLGGRDRVYFAVADARELPVPSASFDVAYSVEAAQHFEERPRFYREIARALRPGGRFFLAAIWGPKELESGELDESCGLRIAEQEDITPHVLRSLARSSLVRNRIVDSLQWPEHFRPLLLSFVGARGAQVYEDFVTGRLVYHRYVLERI